MVREENGEKFIQANSPDGGFLQSEEWRKFQESVKRKTLHIAKDFFWANIVEHNLPVVGRYFYVPRGPIFEIPNKSKNLKFQIQIGMEELISLARKEKVGWVRIEPATEEVLEEIKKNIKYKIVHAPHDMQPKEIFVMDIKKEETELLAEMKAKTRYNIRLAEKRGVKILNSQFSIFNEVSDSNDQIKNMKYLNEFLRLVRVTAERDGIVSHPEIYYRKMIEMIPGENLKLYVAEYEGKPIAANLVLVYGDICTYMHGASDNEHRNVMAPFLLQWRQIQDAKKAGCERYDFGGVMMEISNSKYQISNKIQNSKFKIQNSGSWSGITRFKVGFSPSTMPTNFPGSYDIIINPWVYWLYRGMQKIKSVTR